MLIKLMFTKLGNIFSSSLGKMGILLALLLGLSIILLPEAEGWSISQVLWWFPVTITTVGYGDLSPQSLTGRLLGLCVMFGGIGIASMMITGVITKMTDRRAKKMNGTGYYTKKDHIVIFGWIPGKTKAIIDEIKADSSYKSIHIVLCSDNLENNPLPDEVTFIKGKLSSQDVLERAHITHAYKTIIYTESDRETVLIALGVDAANKNATIVAYVKEEEYAEHIRRIDRLEKGGNISIIKPCSVGLITQELQNAGVADIIRTLLSNSIGKTIFKIPTVRNRFECFNCAINCFKYDDEIHLIGFEINGESPVMFPNEKQGNRYCNHIFLVAKERPVFN